MARKTLVVVVLLGVAVVSAVAAVLTAGGGGPRLFGGLPVVGIIRIDGVITSGDSSAGFFGASTGSDTILGFLREAREDDTVRAVVIRINSPGGSAAGSQEIGMEVEKLRRAGKPVVASMGDVAASGGYWVASGADVIVADPATITGSIGVIMELANLRELYDKIGVDVETIKSGPHKDIGSSSRELTVTERDILQGMVNDIFWQFVDVVAAGRGMKREDVIPLADGRIFTGRQALEAGLIDRLGNFHDAIELAAEMGGITGAFDIKEYGRLSPLERLFAGVAGPEFAGRVIPGQEDLVRRLNLVRELLRVPWAE